MFIDNDPLNLRRDNLGLQEWGASIHHDKAMLVDACVEFERQKLLAQAAGTYTPRYRKVPIITRPVKRRGAKPGSPAMSFDQMFTAL
ncbi:hypothetical protein FJ950_17870 [Mesorhizobium sp. B2-3-14]|uniref:hypothetical protein n=1 Tax=unclassified Mesorhizobium TaxID=325217 RepID=UPI00112A647F|nr:MULTISPECIES: hypothetical protein [unclassified Mesorhizobium]TPL84062.1 hypothetical protein FJ950_17870 [Mesorhizobium sp. B2-3-14]